MEEHCDRNGISGSILGITDASHNVHLPLLFPPRNLNGNDAPFKNALVLYGISHRMWQSLSAKKSKNAYQSLVNENDPCVTCGGALYARYMKELSECNLLG